MKFRAVKVDQTKLVGGWSNPCEKYARRIGSFPQGRQWKTCLLTTIQKRRVIMCLFKLTIVYSHTISQLQMLKDERTQKSIGKRVIFYKVFRGTAWSNRPFSICSKDSKRKNFKAQPRRILRGATWRKSSIYPGLGGSCPWLVFVP